MQTRKTGIHHDPPAHADPHAAPESVLQAYLDRTITPETAPNRIMIVGTGGLGLWERAWRSLALAGTEEGEEYRLSQEGAAQAGTMRAMCFASDLSAQAEDLVRMAGTEHYALTPAGIRQREHFLEHTGEPGKRRARLPSTPAERRMRRFQARFPDWLTRFPHLENIASDAVQLGKHLCFLGLIHGNPALLENGRNTMRAGTRFLDAALTDEHLPDTVIQDIPRPAGNPPGPGPTARRAAAYVRGVEKAFRQGTGETQALATEFIACAVIARLAGQMSQQNMELLHDLGSKDGGIPSEMRAISDDLLQARATDASPPLSRTRDSLSALDEEELETNLRELEEIQNRLLAAAFVEFHQPAPAVPLPRGQDDEMQTATAFLRVARATLPRPDDSTGATGYLREEVRRRADSHLALALESLPRVDAQGWTHGDFTPDHVNYLYYHLRLGAELLPLSQPDSIDRAVQTAQAHPQWRDFLAGRVRFREPGH